MPDYASLTVAQLKEKLKAKDLPLDGKKADLVERLTAAEEPQAESSESKPEEPATEAAPEEAKAETEAPAEAAPEAAKPAPEAPKDAKPEKKILSPEERKQLAVELLTKKIKRAEKFGDDALAAAAKKDLARVEKFGVDPGTALAKEIGAVDRSVNSELAERKFTKKSKKNKNKVKK